MLENPIFLRSLLQEWQKVHKLDNQISNPHKQPPSNTQVQLAVQIKQTALQQAVLINSSHHKLILQLSLLSQFDYFNSQNLLQNNLSHLPLSHIQTITPLHALDRSQYFNSKKLPQFYNSLQFTMQKQVGTYQELVEFIFKNGGIIIADFHNLWCAPCKLISPSLESYRKQYEIAVARIDTEKSEELSTKFDIHAIPTYILLRKSSGEVNLVEMVVGAHPEKLRRLFETGSNIKSNKN